MRKQTHPTSLNRHIWLDTVPPKSTHRRRMADRYARLLQRSVYPHPICGGLGSGVGLGSPAPENPFLYSEASYPSLALFHTTFGQSNVSEYYLGLGYPYLLVTGQLVRPVLCVARPKAAKLVPVSTAGRVVIARRTGKGRN